MATLQNLSGQDQPANFQMVPDAGDAGQLTAAEQVLKDNGGKQYHAGDNVQGMAFAVPFLGGMDQSQWGQPGLGGQPQGPKEGAWYAPQADFDRLNPKSDGGNFFSGLKDAARDFTPAALTIGGSLAGTAGLNAVLGAGTLGIPEAAGALGSAGAGGAAMPAAQALSPEALSSMGLVQTAPGVYEAAGAGALAGGAAAGGALMPPAQPLSAGGAQALGLQPQAGAPGVFSQAAPAGVGGTGGIAAGGGAPAGVGSAPAAGGGAQAGGSFVDTLMKQMKDNALGLGMIGASTLLGAGQKSALPNEQQIQSLSADAQGVAHQLIQQYQSGALSPGQQASLDQLTQNTKNQLKQYFSSIGQGDSSAAAQALAQVDQTALGMKQQMLDSALQQGLSAIGVAQGPLNTIAQFQLGQDQQLKQAFGNFAGAVGNLFGRASGTPQTPTTSATAAPTISSVQSPVPAT